MNPFLECTVARPLPGSHPDRRWPRRSALSQTNDVVLLSEPSDEKGGDQPDTSCPDGTQTGPGRSVRSILTLGLCLAFSSVSGFLIKPAGMAGVAAVATVLMPRSVQAVDLNSATAQQLQALNGIGPKTATMIIEERTRGGNFSSLTDLSDRVRGIGPKKAAALKAAGLKVAAGGGKSGTKAVPASPGKAAKR